ncbi:MAG: hypothetical protein K0U68_16085 [Gammaproteobacteria bacterium]|nr:hypothetical protein [Gammaproteobacteria bacterium]
MSGKSLREFFSSIVILCCVASLGIIAAGSLLKPDSFNAQTTPVFLAGTQFKALIGQVKTDQQQLYLTGLANAMAALSNSQRRFSANYFPFLEINQSGFTHQPVINFFWRKQGQDQSVFTETLVNFHDESIVIDMSRHPQWNGTIIEVGLSFEGELKSSLRLDSVVLQPWSIMSWIHSIWDQWWAYGGWKGTSINFIGGGQYDKLQDIKGPEYPMLPVIAVWLGLSVICYLAICRLKRCKPDSTQCLIMFFLAWVLLDLRWLHEFWMRTDVVKIQYLGKTQHHRWLSENDSEWYAMSQEVKQHITEPTARVFFVLRTQQQLDDYYRYRIRYHLLPHNSYPFLQTLPKPSDLLAGDYILDLGETSSLQFKGNVLTANKLLQPLPGIKPINLIYQTRLARLYRYEGM